MTDDKAPTRMLLGRFDAGHRGKFGVPAYILGAKHAAMLARVWRLYGTEILVDLIDRFYQGNSWADDCGYSIEVFLSQIPRLVMQREKARLETERTNVVAFDWFAECKRLHNGACQLDRYRHGLRMERERDKSEAS